MSTNEYHRNSCIYIQFGVTIINHYIREKVINVGRYDMFYIVTVVNIAQ